MPKPEPIRKIIPVEELRTDIFTDVIELERIVTPDQDKKVDHVFVRRQKICKGNPKEIFLTEEYSRFDIPWPEEVKDNIAVENNNESKVEQEINLKS